MLWDNLEETVIKQYTVKAFQLISGQSRYKVGKPCEKDIVLQHIYILIVFTSLKRIKYN